MLYILPDITETEDALQALKDGNKRFVESRMKSFDLSAQRRRDLSTGQSPHTVVLSCADSRLPPELVFDQGLGDLFVLRIAGNILSREEIGSIEYAVEYLESSLVVIMGHEGCGAVTAAVEASLNGEGEVTENIDAIIGRINPVVTKIRKNNKNITKKELINKSIEENVELGLANLIANSELVVNKIKNNELKIIGAKYKLDTGVVEFGDYYKF